MEERCEILAALMSRTASVADVDESTISEATVFADLKLKSVDLTQITTYLEDECDVEIPFMEFKRKETIGDAADFIVELIEG